MFENVKKFFMERAGFVETDNGVFVHKGLFDKPVSELKGESWEDRPTMDSPYGYFKEMDTKYKSKFEWLTSPVKGVRWDFNPMLTRNLAQDDTWVEMLIINMTKEMANTPWQIVEDGGPEVQKMTPFERVSKGVEGKSAEGIVADEIRRLFRKPNPDESFSEFVTQVVADLLEVGSMCVPKMFPEGAYEGDELVEEDPELVYMKSSMPETFTKDYRGKTGMLNGFYQYDRNRNTSNNMGGKRSGPIRFCNREIVWSDINPRSNRRYGLPPTLIVKDWLMLMDLTTEQEKRYWSRGAFPAGFLKSNGDIEEINMLKGQANEMKGKPENNIMHIADGDADWVQMGLNWNELQMTDREKWYSKIIASAFQVPVSVVGLKPEDVNRATFQGERGNFESNTLGPYLQMLERIFNNQIVKPHFGSEYRFEFVPGMSESQRQIISDRVRNEFAEGLLTRNEARKQLGYGEVEEEMDGFQDEVVESREPPQVAMNVSSDGSDGFESVGKPFAGYDDFDDCVSQNQDKENPEAYCASVHRRATGEWPSEKQESLRESDNWRLFEVQPSDVEELKERISGDVEKVWEELFSSERFNDIVEMFAEDEIEKNSAELRRILRRVVEGAAVSEGIEEAVMEVTGEKALEALNDLELEEDVEVSEDKIVDRIQNRDMSFSDRYSKRMEEEIRDTVSQGWREDKTVDEIKDALKEKAEEFTDFQAERIARDQLQRAAGEARNEFAREAGKVEVWLDTGDDRTRPAHREMGGKWKRPDEDFLVPYDGGNMVRESFPGDSKEGIQCRCTTLLRDESEVDSSDYAGVR